MDRSVFRLEIGPNCTSEKPLYHICVDLVITAVKKINYTISYEIKYAFVKVNNFKSLFVKLLSLLFVKFCK